MSGTLYIVATPIGNLEDVTLRAINTLKEVDIVLAEDTRVTKKLLDYISAFSLQSPVVSLSINENKPTTRDQRLISYHQHSPDSRKLEILSYLLEGKNIALVTDAGTPGISDPGNELIDFLLTHQFDLKIVPIPGASAVTTALSVSGFRADKFLFLGYWPKKKAGKLVKLVRSVKLPFVFYESPHRIVKTLEAIEKVIDSNTRVLVARELTKLHETLYRGTITEVKEKLAIERIKGEIVVIIDL